MAMEIQGHQSTWQLAEQLDRAALEKTASEWRYPLWVTFLLQGRGIDDQAQAERWLNPSFTHMHDPRLLPGCEKAAARLCEAIREKHNIVLYGDYDVDGITASAILYHMIKAIEPAAQVQTYVPHRLEEGYGLSDSAIQQLCEDGAQLIISVDCGITACVPAKVAKDAGVDLIITDHHEMDQRLPEAYALVHPALKNESGELTYPFEKLCGAGVAYKLAWETSRQWCGSDRVSDHLRRMLVELTSFAALGTIADVMPLIDENRALVARGLERVKDTHFTGLNALIDAAGLREEKVDAYGVGFVLGPRLNACGRMGHAATAVELFTQAGSKDAERMAELLNSENARRQRTEKQIVEQVIQGVEAGGWDDPSVKVIVMADERWHAGVIGIVCSRIVEKYHKPVVLMQIEGDVAKGSARSIEGFNIVEAFHACGKHLTKFGGHAAAAGLTMELEKLEPFIEAMKAYASQRIDQADMVQRLKLEAVLAPGELDLNLVAQLESMAPFGMGNPRPNFLLQEMRIVQPPRTVGRDANHLVLQVEGQGRMFRCMAWKMGALEPLLKVGMLVDLACRPKVNEWAGRRSVELEIRDLRW